MVDEQSLHEELKQQLGLPDYYGENLDALWDCLTGWIMTPSIIEWTHFSSAVKNMPSYGEKVLSVLKRAEQQGLIEVRVL